MLLNVYLMSLMLGIANINSTNISLLNNLEIVTTSVITLLILKEKIQNKFLTKIGVMNIRKNLYKMNVFLHIIIYIF